MGTALPRAEDLGVLYEKNGTGTGTYVDIAGVSQLVGTLTGSYSEQVTVPLGIVDYSHPWAGARGALSMFVDIGISNVSSIKMKLQGRYDPSGTWTDLQTRRQDLGAVLAEQVFAAAGTFIVQTASVLAVPQIRIVALGVPQNESGILVGDSIRVQAWVQ